MFCKNTLRSIAIRVNSTLKNHHRKKFEYNKLLEDEIFSENDSLPFIHLPQYFQKIAQFHGNFGVGNVETHSVTLTLGLMSLCKMGRSWRI
jgi:hypothetical protein